MRISSIPKQSQQGHGLPTSKPPISPPDNCGNVKNFTTRLAVNNGQLHTGNGSSNSVKPQSQKLQSASSSRMLTGYELSQEFSNKLEECLENKYGGRVQAHSAASKIQRFYRQYKLRQHFQRVTGGGGEQQRQQETALGRHLDQQKKKTATNTIFVSSIGAVPSSSETRTSGNLQHQTKAKSASNNSLSNSPMTRYQPATSLSSQLRAERQNAVNQSQRPRRNIDLGADQNIQLNATTTSQEYPMRSPVARSHQMQEYHQQRLLMDIPGTPRLCQRRIQQIPSGSSTLFSANRNHQQHPQPITHFHPELYSANTQSDAQKSGSAKTTILVGESKEEENMHVDDTDILTNDNSTCAYHRSQSPAMHSCVNSVTTGLQVVQLQSSPGRRSPSHQNSAALGSRSQGQSPSSSPMRHPQPPPLMNSITISTADHQPKPQQLRSVWMPRQFVTGSSPSMHQQQIQQRQLAAMQQPQHLISTSSSSITSSSMLSTSNGYSSQQHHYSQQQQHQYHRTPVVSRSNSSVAAYATHSTNSLPRVTRLLQQQQQNQQPALVNNNGGIAQNTTTKEPNVIAFGGGGVGVAVMHRPDPIAEQQRRRLYRIALNFFNKKPDRGVQLLIRWGFVEENPPALARLFKERRGLSKQMIGEYLGTLKSPFHAAVLKHFIAEIPIYDMEIDKALRQLLMHFRLPGEAQKIDHIIQAFSQHYVACNSHRLSPEHTPDTVYILAFAIIMLNTDLHTPSLKDSRRMKLDEFIKNLGRVEEGRSLDRQMLTGIYERVKEFEFRAGTDHVTQVLKVDQSIVSKDKPKLVEPHRRLICYCRLHQIMDPNKRQSSTTHQREIFLFNDMMLICKLMGGRRRSSTTTSLGQYQLRYWSLLIGLQVEEFQNSLYNHGMMINFPNGQVLYFNAKNMDDRFRFVADIRESVAESTEMEQWRIQLEVERQQQQGGNNHVAGIGARLAEHNFQLPQSQPQRNRQNGSLPSGFYQQHNTGIGSSSTASAGTTVATMDSVQRDSGLPDMDCHNSAHSTISSPSASPSPADFT